MRQLHRTRRAILFLTCGPAIATLLWGGAVAAGDPVAIVEHIAVKGTSVRFMDYLEAGRVIELGAKGTITVGYLHSCVREIIVGGRITVGRDRSSVEAGKVDRTQVECDGGMLILSPEEASRSGVLVLRRPPGGATGAFEQPAFKIYGASPVIKVTVRSNRVTITRLDRPSEPLTVEIARAFVDLAALGKSLIPGGTYRATAGARTVVFGVDALARPGRGPIVGRLVPL